MSETYKDYHIVWEIDISAHSPKEAAEEALKVQRDPFSMETVFDVWEEGGKQHRIDLLEPEDDEYDCLPPEFLGDDEDGSQ